MMKPQSTEEKLYRLIEHGEIGPRKFNAFGFLISFKSVLLEGLEVVFIVITFNYKNRLKITPVFTGVKIYRFNI